MSRFSGKQYKGAQKARKELRREEAEERNAKTPPERRRAYRRDPANKLIVDVFTGEDPA